MKYALITGVSSGIGKSASKRLLALGYTVFGSVRKSIDSSDLEREFPNQFVPLVFDVRDENAIDLAIKKVEDILNGKLLNVLINNAGVAYYGPLAHVDPERLREQLDINVISLVRITQKVLPFLGYDKISKEKGMIINVSSISGIIARPFMGPYSASKFAVEAISDAMRRELDLMGIKVFTLRPGPIDTRIWQKAREEKEDYLDTPFKPYLEKKDKMIKASEKDAIDVNHVSDVILKIIQGKLKKPNYIIAKKKKLIHFIATFVPDYFVDKLVRKQLKKLINFK